MPSIEMKMLLPTTTEGGDPALSVRKVAIRTDRIAYFHGTPDGDQVMLQCDGGAHVHLRATGPEVLQAIMIAQRDEAEMYHHFTMLTYHPEKKGAPPTEVPVQVNEHKVNLVVPNPDNTTSIQIGSGYVLHVKQEFNNVRGSLGI